MHASKCGDMQKLLLPCDSALSGHLVQGAALEELLALFPAVLVSNGMHTSFDSLLASLLAAGVAPETGKAAQHSVAQCIARMSISAGPARVSVVVKGLLGQLQVHLVSKLQLLAASMLEGQRRCCFTQEDWTLDME